MELDAAYVQFAVAESHNLTFVAFGGHFETRRQPLTGYHPRVITSDGDVAFNAAEDGVVGYNMTGRRHTMKHVCEILQLSAKCLANGLMAEADA